jgi:hypothetical protein
MDTTRRINTIQTNTYKLGEKEYAKLEPYHNIYTGKGAQVEEKSRKELDGIRQTIEAKSSELESLKKQFETLNSQFSQILGKVPSGFGPAKPTKKAMEVGEAADRKLKDLAFF